MPSMIDLTSMKFEQVLDYIRHLPTSNYAGYKRSDISQVLKRGEARRYLGELILQNDMKKANFDPILD